jgi:small subunit ribosomal protein S21
VRKDRPKQGLTVSVRGDDINGAMRVLKKRMQDEGIFNEMRERVGHKTRSERRRLEKAAGRKRWLKKIDKLKEEGKWHND